jgi:hypothetical protein
MFLVTIFSLGTVSLHEITAQFSIITDINMKIRTILSITNSFEEE